jgi:alpha-glucosidase
MKKLCLLLLAAPAHAMPQPTLTPTLKGVILRGARGELHLEVVEEGILRVHTPRAHASLVVKPTTAPAPYSRSPQALSTSLFRVSWDEKLRLTFADNQGKLICKDLVSPPSLAKSSGLDEFYYGCGDATGPLNRRDRSLVQWNSDAYWWQESTDPLYKAIPFFLGLKEGRCWGLYLDSTYRTHFGFQRERRDAITMHNEGPELDYYLMVGPQPAQVMQRYTALVGRPQLPPKWALGYQQSRGSYLPDSKVREVAARLRSERIPCDVIYLDGDYKDKAHPFSVDSKTFPDLPGLLAHLRSLQLRTVMSLDPYLAKNPSDPKYREAVQKGYFVKNREGSVYYGKVWPGEVAWADFAQSRVRHWWGELHRPFLKAGVAGIWDDMNEPAAFYRLDKSIPLDKVHQVEARKTSHAEIHNLFGYLNSQATYQGLRRLRPQERPFVLTRSGFAGGGQYAATWTGDNFASWNHMRLSVPQLLNLGLGGYALCGADIGGYSGGVGGGPSPELLTRWMQLGAFQPLFRNHSDGTTREREPWVDGPVHLQARRAAIEARYQLLPYLYTYMAEAARTGSPLMRPMFFEFPQERALAPLGEQYMLGPALLVAPKLWEGEAPVVARLPQGAWYDYWTGRPQTGGKVLELKPALEELPVFLRAGSVVPRQSLVQHCEEQPQGPLELLVGLGGSGDSWLYWDDGISHSFEKGRFSRVRLRLRGRELEMTPEQLAHPPSFQQVQLTVYGPEGVRKLPPLDWKPQGLSWRL